MLRVVVGLLAVLIASSASAEALPPVGARGTVDATTFGCRWVRSFEKSLRLIVDKDYEAFRAFVVDTNNGCTVIAPGQVLTIDETSISKGIVCARPRGEVDCLWIGPSFFKKSSE